MATSTIPAAIDWCVTTFRASTTLGAHPTLPVQVFDGPEVADTSSRRQLWVGTDDPDNEQAQTAAESQQQWAGLGARRKDELSQIFLTARAWSGDEGLAAVRVAVFEIVGAVENVVRDSANLGGTVLVTLPGVTDLRLRQNSTPEGAIAEVTFRLDSKARI